MVPLFNSPKKEALTRLASWRKQLLILFDGQCVDGNEDFEQIYQEILEFAETLFKENVPEQYNRMQEVLSITDYTTITKTTSDAEKQKICIETIIAVDEILDEWVWTIGKKGLPPGLDDPFTKT